MEDFLSFFILLTTITIFYTYLEWKSTEVTYVESMIDGGSYLVRKREDMGEAANLLAQLNTNLKAIIEHCSDPKNQQHYTEQNIIDIKRLKRNYNEEAISESSPGNKYTSYSINKGEKIVFCLREKDGSDKLIDLNTLMFVAIHELAHLMTKSIGHTPEFWDNMRFLLKIGIDIGVYKYQNFISKPVSYCGMTITDTPLKI
tara:strand:+ start:200 stop:802 length:603 start_codon:yes stop_codon:yes gene_type:complete